MKNNCPLCQGKSKLYLSYDKIGKGDLALYCCSVCGLIYTHPLPTDNYLSKYYQDYDSIGKKYLYYKDAANYENTNYGRKLKKKIKKLINNYSFLQNKKVLDLGSGAGIFSDILQKNGCYVQGVEISKVAAEFSNKNFGLKTLIGSVDFVDLPHGEYEAIFMWDLLEHLANQKGVIKKTFNWLLPGGLLIIETPSSRALINKIILFLFHCGLKWPAVWMFGPHHLYIHSEKSLKKLLTDKGFKIVEIKKANTKADRIFPLKGKFIIPRMILEIINCMTHIVGGKNKLFIIAKKYD